MSTQFAKNVAQSLHTGWAAIIARCCRRVFFADGNAFLANGVQLGIAQANGDEVVPVPLSAFAVDERVDFVALALKERGCVLVAVAVALLFSLSTCQSYRKQTL